MAKMGYRLSEPLTITEEKPTVLQDIIDVYRRSHGFTVAEMSSLVSSFEHEFRRRFLPEPAPHHFLRVVKNERERVTA